MAVLGGKRAEELAVEAVLPGPRRPRRGGQDANANGESITGRCLGRRPIGASPR